MFFLASTDLIPTIRKALGEQLMYVEAYIRTGAVGSILGVPIYTSKAVPSGMMFMATKDAVTAFIKKGTFVEQDRDIDKKENFIVASRYTVIALTDESKCVACGKAQATAATVTTATKETKVISGAATTGAKVKAYVNGIATGAEVEASGNTYSITANENLKSGDVVRVVASLNGFLNSVAIFTVA